VRIFNKEPTVDLKQFTEAWHVINCTRHCLGFRNQRSSYWVNKRDQILRISTDLVQSAFIWWFYQLYILLLADSCKFSELEAWNLQVSCIFQTICTKTTDWTLYYKKIRGGWLSCQTCCDREKRKPWRSARNVLALHHSRGSILSAIDAFVNVYQNSFILRSNVTQSSFSPIFLQIVHRQECNLRKYWEQSLKIGNKEHKIIFFTFLKFNHYFSCVSSWTVNVLNLNKLNNQKQPELKIMWALLPTK
jgi:hypothetical protein